MKKLALVMVFVLLMALFIGFNYLLWDRENKEKALSDLQLDNATNTANISAQNREIKSLEDENGTLQARISQLENDQQQLQQSKDKVTAEKDQVSQSLVENIAKLNEMKQLIDIKLLQEPARKWAEALDTGKYEQAYELEYAGIAAGERTQTLEQYSQNLKNEVKRVSLKSVDLDPEKGYDTGDIFIKVILEVTLNDNTGNSLSGYTNGENTRYCKLIYDSAAKAFTIAGISS